MGTTAHKDCLPRLCSDGEAVHLYYTTDNSRVYHQEELKSFEVNAEVDWRSCGNRWGLLLFSPPNKWFLPAHGCCRVSDSFLSEICHSRKSAVHVYSAAGRLFWFQMHFSDSFFIIKDTFSPADRFG